MLPLKRKKKYSSKPQKERFKRHEIERRDTLHRLEKIERKIHKQEKTSVVFGVIAFVCLVTMGMEWVTFGFAIASFSMFYGLKDLKRKRDFLLAEYSTGAMETVVHDGFDTTTAEKIILKHAHGKKGKVYPEILAVESDLSLNEIERMLATCVDKHLASIEIDKNGRTFYYFSSFDDPYDPFADLDKK